MRLGIWFCEFVLNVASSAKLPVTVVSMVMCFAPDCKHYSERGECKSFFRFPKNCLERRKWITLLRRSDREPTQYSLVCSCHFKDGDKTNGPTIFRHNVGKRFSFESFPKKRKTGKSVIAAADMTASVTEISSSPGEGVNTEIQRPEKVVVTEGNMDTSQVESAENRDYNSDSETDTADETEDIDEKLLGQFDFVDVKESDVDYPSNGYLPEDVSALDVKQEPIDESPNEGEFSIKLEPCDLTEYEEKPDLFMLANFEYFKNEHDYCRSNDMENDEKDVDFWRKEVKKLRQEIFRRNREIRIAKDEIESMRNQIAMNNEILKEYLTQQKCKESIGLTN